jgi:N-acetylglutamate synthase-like GNAT family acetyltransferase
VKKLENALGIRPAQLGDQEDIRNLLSEFMLPLEGLENTKMWVLQEDNGNVVGTVGLEVWGKNGLLRSLAVKKNLQNKGYGTCLVNYLVDESRKDEITDLFLLTQTGQSFFGKIGFRKIDSSHITESIKDSAEFKGACPTTATLMHLKIKRTVGQ